MASGAAYCGAVAIGAIAVLHRRSSTETVQGANSSVTSAERPLLGTLAVLRRPQTASDLDRALRRQLDRPSFGPPYARPVIPLIRRAVVTRCCGQVFLIPVARISEQALARLKRQRPRLTTTIADWRRADQLFVYTRARTWGSGSCCATASRIRESGIGSYGTGSNGASSAVLVVPDGVIKIVLRIGPPTITVFVHDNVAAFNYPGESDPFQDMTWYGPTGRIVHASHQSRTAGSTARSVPCSPRPRAATAKLP
ncbi:MAG: hypothetical protein ACLP4R_21270 [Solirubrobacteraceae bacterium]